MNIFLHELKRNKNAFIIWTIATILLIFSQMAVFSSFVKDSIASQQALLTKYPAALIEIFGISKIDMSNVLGYFAVKIFPLVALIGSIYTMLLATGILSKEHGEKTIEFLLSKPISRKSVVSSKLLSVIFYTVLYNLMLFLSTYGMLEIYKNEPYNLSVFALLWVSLLLLNIAFATIGFLISVFVSKTKTNYPLSIGIIIGSYVISVIAATSQTIEKLKYLSLFSYFDAAEIIVSGNIAPIYLALFALFIIVPILLSYLFFNKKRITV